MSTGAKYADADPYRKPEDEDEEPGTDGSSEKNEGPASA